MNANEIDFRKNGSCFFSDKPAFYLISNLDGRAVKSKPDGSVQTWTLDLIDKYQMWIQSDFGQQLINLGTKLPMKAGPGRNWHFDEKEGLMWDVRRPEEVLDRGWDERDGIDIGTFSMQGGLNQRFLKRLVGHI